MKTSLRFFPLLALVACLVPGDDLRADPPPITDLSAIFCFRITGIEESFTTPGEVTFTMEVLNWTDAPAYGLYMAQADPVAGSPGLLPGGPVITGNGIDADGGNAGAGIILSRGVAPGGVDGEHHSGRGTAVMPGFLNDWVAESSSATHAAWNGTGATAIPNRDLVGAFNSGGGNNLAAAQALVPGFGFDQLGDSAIDGGPGPYFGGGVEGEAGEPVPFGSGNVLDGFTLTISDFNPGDVIALNWFLLDAGGVPLGTATGGNTFGFGVLNLFALGSELALDRDGSGLPGPVFVGNTGANQDVELFAAVPAGFFTDYAGEVGGGITAPFLNPGDNIFGAAVNTQAIPEPSRALLALLGVIAMVARRRR